MATYEVTVLLEFDERPSRDDQAFLGPLGVKVQPWGSNDLQVYVEVTASDIGAALVSARELVAPLGGEAQSANIGLKGFRARRKAPAISSPL